VFCQNHQISREGLGRSVSGEEFARICLALEARGAENINIVTGSHGVPAIVLGVAAARSRGLSVPVLWNSSAYESIETLGLLETVVDVYLPDLKTLDSSLARRFFHAPDYPEYAAGAILKMLEFRGTLRFGHSRGGVGETVPPGKVQVITAGVIIRHLMLPDQPESTREVIRWFAENCRGRALLSLMTQYTPVGDGPGRYVNEREYEMVLRWFDEFGIEEGFYQELSPDNEWLPDFKQRNPFLSGLSLPVWHWKYGFI
jgi:putative pyruvate formate lyase activating enzyme